LALSANASPATTASAKQTASEAAAAVPQMCFRFANLVMVSAPSCVYDAAELQR